ncbi:MAG: hypothetical protein M1839_009133 [Geoglossum umbratile]|nr:MAG: hypothetical protein M1839_009133 [Geoglossum umbratile]
MEGLGIAASVVAIVQLTELALKLAHKHIGLGPSRFDNAGLQSISRTLYAFNGVLRNLQTNLRINEADEARLQTLNHLSEPLNQCGEALRLLSDRLENQTFARKHIIGERFDRKLVKALSVIEDARKLVELALLSDQHIIINAVEQYLHAVAEDVRDVHTTLSENTKRLAEIEDSSREWHQQFRELKLSQGQDNIIQWLQYTDPSTNHNAACEKREPLTGNWLLRSDDFAKWKQEPNQLLWLHGIPGCGKTILSSTIAEHIKAICKRDPRCQCALYYFDFSDSKKQEVAGFLRSVLVQLASRDMKTLKEVEKLYNQNDDGKQQPDKKSLLSVMLTVLRSSCRTYLIIDALDECSQREELLKVLSDIRRQCSEEVNVLLTSRKEHDIELVLDGLATSSIGIQQTAVDADIRIHVKNYLVEDAMLKRWPSAVKEEVEDALVKGAHGMFRWVVCQLAVLRNCLKLPALRQKLKELPETLDETYDRILLSIPKDCYQEAHAVLQWLTYSRRPMSLAEVAEAISVDRDNQIFDPENRMLDVSSILNICSSLVTLLERKTTFGVVQTEEMRELRLAHYSVKEYLVSKRIQESKANRFAVKETEAHEYMGESCLIYLLYFNQPDSISGHHPVNYPFLMYAVKYWHGHRRAILDASPGITDLSMALFDTKRGAQFFNWLKLYDPGYFWTRIDPKGEIKKDVLVNYACRLGIFEVVEMLLASGADVNTTASANSGRTALEVASWGGYFEVVERFLAAGADVNTVPSINDGWTALQEASRGGHLKVVEKLLASGADVNTATSRGWTALKAASTGGHIKVVERLLAVGADANVATSADYSQTALQAAAEGGYIKVVERLLTAGADVNAAATMYGLTALQVVSRNGHLKVIERLLANGADVNAAAATTRGLTALQAASIGGHLGIVEKLLADGADVNGAACTTSGRTALQAASENGHLEVVERLLADGADVNAAACTTSGRTALQGASENGHLEVVERLLADGADVNGGADVNAAACTTSGRTALQAASENGRLEVVKRLLADGADVNAAAATTRGLTALQAAFIGGHPEIVERLLAAGADASDPYGVLTALQEASIRGHSETTKRRLESMGISYPPTAYPPPLLSPALLETLRARNQHHTSHIYPMLSPRRSIAHPVI